jgi:hypothetical protein
MKMKKTWGFVAMLAVMALGLASCGNDAVSVDESVNKGEPTEIKIKISLPSGTTRSDGSYVNTIKGSIFKKVDGEYTYESSVNATLEEDGWDIEFTGYTLEEYEISLAAINEKAGWSYWSTTREIYQGYSGITGEIKDCFIGNKEFSGRDSEITVELTRVSSRINIITTQTDKSKIKFNQMKVYAELTNGINIKTLEPIGSYKHTFYLYNNPESVQIDGKEHMLLGFFYVLPTFQDSKFSFDIDKIFTASTVVNIERNTVYNLIGDFFVNNIYNTVINIDIQTDFDKTNNTIIDNITFN